MKRSVVIFGGTFDPPHRAHTELPPKAAEYIGAERIIYVPAAISPFKTEQKTTSAEHRLAMLRLALSQIERAEISEIELIREGTSYTIDTVAALRREVDPDVQLRLLIGADQAASFGRWREYQRIIELAPPLVMLRPPYTADALLDAIADFANGDEIENWRQWIIPLELIGLSSTELRDDQIRATLPTDSIDPAVRAYIEEHGLYGRGASV